MATYGHPRRAGERAPDIALQDECGGAVRLSDFWRQGPVLLVFTRHFG